MAATGPVVSAISPPSSPNNRPTHKISHIYSERHMDQQQRQRNIKVGAWTLEEHVAFVMAMRAVSHTHPNRWKQIADAIPTRNPTQVRTHAVKHFRTLSRREGLVINAIIPQQSPSSSSSSSSASLSEMKRKTERRAGASGRISPKKMKKKDLSAAELAAYHKQIRENPRVFMAALHYEVNRPSTEDEVTTLSSPSSPEELMMEENIDSESNYTDEEMDSCVMSPPTDVLLESQQLSRPYSVLSSCARDTVEDLLQDANARELEGAFSHMKDQSFSQYPYASPAMSRPTNIYMSASPCCSSPSENLHYPSYVPKERAALSCFQEEGYLLDWLIDNVQPLSKADLGIC